MQTDRRWKLLIRKYKDLTIFNKKCPYFQSPYPQHQEITVEIKITSGSGIFYLI